MWGGGAKGKREVDVTLNNSHGLHADDGNILLVSLRKRYVIRVDKNSYIEGNEKGTGAVLFQPQSRTIAKPEGGKRSWDGKARSLKKRHLNLSPSILWALLFHAYAIYLSAHFRDLPRPKFARPLSSAHAVKVVG